MFTLDASVHSSGNLFLPFTSLLILNFFSCQLNTLQCKHGSVCYPIVLSAHDWHKGEQTGVLSICVKS